MSGSVILASGSDSRKAMLDAAGVPFTAMPARVDEAEVKRALLAERASARDVADALAELKAMRASTSVPAALVIGADQILVCEGRLHDKAESREEAREILRTLRGKPHELVTAAVIAREGAAIWRQVETARLWMRDFSDAFLDTYLDAEGEAALGSVGCYRIEGLGAQLFERVVGDQFAIRGLPLIPLLDALRVHGALPR